MSYQVSVWRIDDNGERAVVVVDDQGIPHDQVSRYLLGKRNNRATKTVLNLGKNVCQLYRWSEELGIDIEDRIKSGQIFGITEIDSLVAYLSMNQRQLKKQNEEQGNDDCVLSFAGYVTASVLAQKIDVAKDYFKWLGNLAIEGRLVTDPYYAAIGPAIKDLNDALDARKVTGTKKARIGLTVEEQQFLLSVTHPEHSQNPFESRTRIRNHLIFKLLMLCGVRLGELLALGTINCHLLGDDPYLRFGQNLTKEVDPRSIPPEAKTLPRNIYLTAELAAEVDSYIMNERKARGRIARKAPPYVFLNTLKEPAPMTEGSIYHMCQLLREKFPKQLANLHPHRLRHSFNDNLALMFADSAGDEEFLKLQRWLNGWSNSSKEGQTYTLRSTEIRGQRCLQMLQENILKGNYHEQDYAHPEPKYDEDIDM
ncbi:site-specific integrase [Vibrio lentus]|uniref:site-specific integrase n=1 Tax=Vibrio lentus TaxID=136468 RepID=UPI00178C9DFB|nr:site-specific integrase [Vibrio lentus]MDN3632566.1 site-specific integrase [Vibrio lentus]